MAATHPLHGPVHHYGYVVDNLEKAIDHAIETLGAGPFFRIDHVPLDSMKSDGAPATFDHSSAFGECGDTLLELMEIHTAEPAAVEEGFALPRPQLHHIAFVVPSLEDGIETLAQAGIPAYLEATLGAIHFTYHDGSGTFGHDVELHQDSPDFQGFWTNIRGSNAGWDGSDPVRSPFG